MSNVSCLFLGDSITDAGHLWEADDRMLGHGFVRIISQSPAFSQARLVNRGQDGFTSADLLRLVKGCRDLDGYDCITVLIGVNDLSVAQYANPQWVPEVFSRNISDVLAHLRQFHTGRLLVLEPFLFVPPAEHLHLMPKLSLEREILRSAARDYAGEYLPLQEALNHAVLQQGTDAITTDGIHLTPEGNRILARQWLDHMG